MGYKNERGYEMKQITNAKSQVVRWCNETRKNYGCACSIYLDSARSKAKSYAGQGTTEYAILVGVLVVIAILAITIFRPKIQELWDAISSGINGL